MAFTKIKLNHSKENKEKGFYLLMTTCNTRSTSKDEFIIDERYINVLNQNNIIFERVC